jgi:hypothetical protein
MGQGTVIACAGVVRLKTIRGLSGESELYI